MNSDRNKSKNPSDGFSRPFRLIIVFCCLAGVGLWLFEQYIAGLDDSPNGATPLSWGFKMKTRNVEQFFSLDQSLAQAATPQDQALPQLDLRVPARTETALFALG